MNSKLQEKQSEIDSEIVAAVIECTPEEYFDFELTLTYLEGQGTGSVEHILNCRDNNNLILTPSEDVFNAVRRLTILFAEHDIKWEKITYHIFCDDDDNWRFEADFSYLNGE